MFVGMCINDFWMEMREGAGRKRKREARKEGREGRRKEGFCLKN